MRIFFFFLKLAIFSSVVGALVYFFGGTLWLQVGSYAFQQDVAQLPLYDHNIAVYTHMCQQSPQASDNSTPIEFQIRFLDDRQYVVEVVCSLIENSPIEIKRATLPLFIAKLPGSAGLVFPVDPSVEVTSAVRLGSINKQLGIELKGDTVSTGQAIEPLVGLYPKAECASFGYSCCTEGSQAGKGDPLSRSVTDCPTRCFPACGSVPFVELFNSDPPYEQESREVSMNGNSLDVIFNYGVNPKTVKNVHIEYGDGKNQDSTLADGIFSHTYTCSAACRYVVTLTTTDSSGVSSVETSQSKIYIVKK